MDVRAPSVVLAAIVVCSFGCTKRSKLGESCTRSDDCEGELRCIAAACVPPEERSVEGPRDGRDEDRPAPRGEDTGGKADKVDVSDFIELPDTIGTSLSQVSARFGRPHSVTSEVLQNPHADETMDLSTVVYPGLKLSILTTAEGRGFLVHVVVTAAEVDFARPLRVGMNRADVMRVLGVPTLSTDEELRYCLPDAHYEQCLDIGLANGRVTRMEWSSWPD